jgi:hypothetical protein
LMRRSRPLLLVRSTARSDIFKIQHTVLMVKNCKPVFLEGFLQPMIFQWILDLVVSGECLFRCSKPCLVRMFSGVHFLCCLHSVIFKFRQTVDVRRRKTTNLIFDVLLLLRGHFVLLSIVCINLCFP